MKVLHLSSEKVWRGGEQQIAYLIEELNKYGVKNFVACRKNSPFEEHCIKNQIEQISLSFTNTSLSTAWQIKNLCNSQKIDILHMHSSKSHTMGVLASLLGVKSNLVLSRRVIFLGSTNWLNSYKYNFSKIKQILCISKKVKEVISPIIKNKNKLKIIYSGIDVKRFEGKTDKKILHSEYNLDECTKIVANISALAPHKGHFTFVDTVRKFKEISQEKVKFFAIGEGNRRKDIEQYIEKKGLQNDIILTGFRKDVPDIFPEIDVLLMTSEKEGLGSIILETFANKIPVVATDGGGVHEMVKDKKTGLLYEIKDSEGLAKGLETILNDKEFANELKDNAYKLLLEKFTKEITAKKTLEVYKNVSKVKL